MVDALASGASGRKAVEVRVLSWAPKILKLVIDFKDLRPTPKSLPTPLSTFELMNPGRHLVPMLKLLPSWTGRGDQR